MDLNITAENVMELKQAVITLKTAYRNYCISLSANNEAALLPVVLPDLIGVKGDLTAVKDSIDNYSKISLDDMERPTGNPLDLKKKSDILKLSGGFTLTDVQYDEIKAEVDGIFDGVRRSRAPGSIEVTALGEDNYLSEGTMPDSEGFSGSMVASDETFFKEKYKGNFLNSLLQDCIPCDFRIASINALNPFAGLIAMFEGDLIAKFTALISQFKQLLTNNDILDDICSLLNFLNFQCIPDLFGMLSTLSMLMLKLADIKLLNPTGLFQGMLSAIFSPIFTGLAGLLDKYIQLILGPIDCIINSLDSQISKLDVGAGFNAHSNATLSFLNNRTGQIKAKIRALESRRDYLLQMNMDGTYANEDSSVLVIGGQTITGRDVFSSIGLDTLEREQEVENINDDIRDLKQEAAEVEREKAKLKQKEGMPTLGRRATAPLKEFRASLGDSLHLLREGLTDGTNMINGTMEVLKQEIQRLIQGRAFNTEDRLEGARNIQRLARLIGIIRALIALAKTGDLCKGNDGMQAIGSFLRTVSSIGGDLGNHVFYYGKDNKGQERLIVLTDEATLEMEDIEMPDLNDIVRLNTEGTLIDTGTNEDYKASGQLGKATVGVMALNLCGDLSISATEDLVNVKKWLSTVK